MCPCDFYYTSILRSQLMTVDPNTGISAETFLNSVTETKFFGREWKPLFVIDKSVTERASIGSLGVEGVNDVEVFVKNFHETTQYQNAGGPIGNIAGEGKNHIPTKDPGRCTTYYPDLFDPRCSAHYGGYNFGSTNSKWTFSGSQFLSTAVPTDFINGGGDFCYIALLDKDIEYNFKNIEYNNLLTIDTTFKGKVAIQSMGISGLNVVGVATYEQYSDYTFTNNITGNIQENKGLANGGFPNQNIYPPCSEYFHECQYAGLSDFVARPFSLKSTGIFFTPVLNVAIEFKQTKLPCCNYDPILQKNVAVPFDPDNPCNVYMYNRTATFKPQLGSITIDEL